MNNTNPTVKSHSRKILESLMEDHALPEGLRDKIRIWYADDKNRRMKDRLLYRLFEQYGEDPYPDSSVYEAFEELSRRIGLAEYAEEYYRRKRVPLRRNLVFRIAAVVIPLVVLGVAGMLITQRTLEKPEPATVIAMAADGSGETESILPDSSKVTVLPDSKVIFKKDFDQNRTVEVSGEVVFNVESKPDKKPFVAKTSHLTVTVTGTVFRIEAPEEGDYTRVSLYEGEVSVEAGSHSVILNPGQTLAYNHTTDKIETGQISNTYLIEHNFKPSLKMKDMTLGEIIRTIEAYYEVSFDIPAGASLQGRYSANYRDGETLQRVLQLLQTLAPEYRYRIEGNRVIMTKTK